MSAPRSMTQLTAFYFCCSIFFWAHLDFFCNMLLAYCLHDTSSHVVVGWINDWANHYFLGCIYAKVEYPILPHRLKMMNLFAIRNHYPFAELKKIKPDIWRTPKFDNICILSASNKNKFGKCYTMDHPKYVAWHVWLLVLWGTEVSLQNTSMVLVKYDKN